MSFGEGYDFFPIEFVFVDAWFDCMSKFWVHDIQELLEFDGSWDLALQPVTGRGLDPQDLTRHCLAE